MAERTTSPCGVSRMENKQRQKKEKNKTRINPKCAHSWWTNERRWDEVRRAQGEPFHSVRIGVILFNKLCKIELKKEKCERAYVRSEFCIILFPSCQMPFKSAEYEPGSSAGWCMNNGSRHTYRRSIVVDQSERARIASPQIQIPLESGGAINCAEERSTSIVWYYLRMIKWSN